MEIYGQTVSVTPMKFGLVIAFAQSNGMIEFRNRQHMQPVVANLDPTLDTVSTMMEAGFVYSIPRSSEFTQRYAKNTALIAQSLTVPFRSISAWP